MRLNYFGYYVENNNSGAKYLYDIREIISAFCRHGSVELKKTFVYNGENVYLFHHIGDLYLFITTRSNEIIKKINSENLDVNEIYSALEANECLGFASYVYIKDKYICFSSTMLAPKITWLSFFINELFKKIGCPQYNVKFNAFLYQSSRDEVMNMPFIGRTTIEFSKENTLGEDFIRFIGASREDIADFGSFELVIKPEKRRSVDKLVKKILPKISDQGMTKFIAKAKEDVEDSLTDLYIIGRGAICDTISPKNENDIYNKILRKTANNKILEEKITEFTNNGYITQNRPEEIAHYSNADAWANIIPHLQETTES
jgi:hypothetical protein